MAATSGVTQIVSGTTALPADAKTSDKTTLAGNFQTFLTLLTTQLQNQNPLDPLDTNQFTQQLVQFAGVEQQLKMNDQLTSLIAVQKSAQSTEALAFVGKTAIVDASTASLSNGSATWTMTSDSAASVDITVTNAAGQTVYSATTAMSAGTPQPFTWDGKGSDGTVWPDGTYTLKATGKDSSGASVKIATQSRGVVDSVDLTQSPPLLTIGQKTFTVSQIKGIVN